jgi:hypothetical protein
MVHSARQPRGEVLDTNAKLTVSQSAEILEPGRQACVRHLEFSVRKADVRIYPGFVAATAPTLRVTVLDRSGAVLARASATDYANGQFLAVPVDVRRPRSETRICVHNAGPDGVSLAHAELPQQGRPHLPIRIDISTRPEPAFERLPVALTRAAFFKSNIVSRVLIVGLFLLVLMLAAAAVFLVMRGPSGEDVDA